MSTHIEWAGAKDTYVELLYEGDELGEDTVQEGNVALCLDYGECFVIEGTPDEMLGLVERMAKAISEYILKRT